MSGGDRSQMQYTKVNNFVTIVYNFGTTSMNSTATSTNTIGITLPFTVKTQSLANLGANSIARYSNWQSGGQPFLLEAQSGTNIAALKKQDGTAVTVADMISHTGGSNRNNVLGTLTFIVA